MGKELKQRSAVLQGTLDMMILKTLLNGPAQYVRPMRSVHTGCSRYSRRCLLKAPSRAIVVNAGARPNVASPQSFRPGSYTPLMRKLPSPGYDSCAVYWVRTRRLQASMIDAYLVQYCEKLTNETQSVEFPSPIPTTSPLHAMMPVSPRPIVQKNRGHNWAVSVNRQTRQTIRCN